ncbi:hypothetical protein EVAR_31368_1 [Eumeta japonica]|uniref:Uncharacterized protein n=1 Tax=Eumeta variegata TaxID=151549 RepID=A0A4C1XCS1_EUMVA|nr:hypothetical protein EVAR_31368_1 [Eumeta japonica]
MEQWRLGGLNPASEVTTMFNRDSISISVRDEKCKQNRDQEQKRMRGRFVIKRMAALRACVCVRVWVLPVWNRERERGRDRGR